MACCTTISPLNSAQKRSSGGIFDLPRSAKRRRPLSSNFLANSSNGASLNSSLYSTGNSFSSLSSSSSSSSSQSTISTMYTTTQSILTSNKPIIIDASGDKKQSVFQTPIPYSPMSSVYGVSPSSSSTSSSNDSASISNENDLGYKNELMERIKYEAKRLIRRKQMGVSGINMISTNGTSENNMLSSNSTSSSSNSTSPSSLPSSPISSQPASPSSSSTNIIINNSDNTNKKINSITNSIIKQKTSSNLNVNMNINLLNSTNTNTAIIQNTTNTTNTNKSTILNHNDVPLFSMNQAIMICEKMLQEKEQYIREHYDKILTQKLSEQYDAFVKFTHEQIQRRFENSQCSYVS